MTDLDIAIKMLGAVPKSEIPKSIALIVIAEELKKLNEHLRKGQTCIVEQGEE